MTHRWVAIQRNPSSGAGPKRARIWELVEQLRRHGLRPRLFSRRERLDEWLSHPEKQESLVCIVAAGGDGTVVDVINRFPGVPIAILPLGTENLFARYLHIGRSGKAVADLIAAGQSRRIDLGAVGDRRFVIMASIGFDADVVHRTHARRRGHIRRFSYIQPIGESLRKYRYPKLRLFLDGSETAVNARLAVLTNLPMYALRLRVSASALEDDGFLDICLFEQGSAFQMLRYFYKVVCRTHEKLPDVKTVRATRVRIESDVPVPIQIDGDPAGQTPAEFRVLPGALEVFVPASAANA